jgi:hypothetical protein
MNRRWQLILLGLLIFLAGCEPVPVQYPPGSAQYPYPGQNPDPSAANSQQPQTQVTGSQRWQHAWNKAMEGIVMGGSIGGPYGAGGGLVLGLIAGLFTADSYYGALTAQIQTEQQKDQALETAIEQELERQKALENQIAQASAPNAANGSDVQPVSQVSQVPTSSPQTKTQDNTTYASLKHPPPPAVAPKPFKNVDVRDINGDGVPDLWVYYDPQKPGEIMRQEEASKGDGRVDTWSYFKDGKLLRREVDTKGRGRPDAVFFYDGDQITREERDETGEGRMTYRASYRNGRLDRLEKETSGSGRSDLWLYYDTTQDGEVIIKEERDLNGDGIPDLWTYYDKGRLVRRDVSAIGLELLSKQEQIPATAGDPKQVSTPGS